MPGSISARWSTPNPSRIDDLWQRADMAAVFMCGLPFSRSLPRPELIAAPVPSPPDFRGLPQYWSEMVVRRDSPFRSATGHLRRPPRADGSWTPNRDVLAAMTHLMTVADRFPLYREVIAPQVTPLGAMSAVVDGAADVAPIDSYAYCLLQKYRRDLTSQLRSIARTPRTPIPPLVASRPGFEALHRRIP